MPAVVTWIGDNSNFNEADNWNTNSVPTSGDILVFTGLVSPPPPLPPPPGWPMPPSSPVPPPPYSNQSVTFPTTADLSFAGIRLLNGYGGTVTFPVNVSFSEYTQNSGATAQYADTVVSIGGTFGWVGGTINTTANDATYQLKAVLMGQIGEDTTSLSSGSNIVLDQDFAGIGTVVNLAGVVNVAAGRVIEVMDTSTLNLKQIQVALPPGGNAPKTNDIVNKGVTKVYDNATIDSLDVNGGKVTIKAEKRLTVTGKVPSTLVGVQMKNGELTIEKDGELKSTFEVYLDKSKIFGVPDGDANSADRFTIIADILITETTIQLTPDNVIDWTVLDIQGTAKFNDGLFKAGVKGNLNLKSDVIEATKFDTNHNFKIQVIEKDGSSKNGNVWDVMKSSQAFQSTTDIPASTGYTTSLQNTNKDLRVKR